MTAMSTAVRAGVNKKTAASLALVTEIILVLGFECVIQESRFALLYINITITICASLPRICFVGTSSEPDISLRVDMQWFWTRMLAQIFLTAMIICEPFFCDMFLSEVGGHLLFDFSLYFIAFTDILNKGVARHRFAAK